MSTIIRSRRRSPEPPPPEHNCLCCRDTGTVQQAGDWVEGYDPHLDPPIPCLACSVAMQVFGAQTVQTWFESALTAEQCREIHAHRLSAPPPPVDEIRAKIQRDLALAQQRMEMPAADVPTRARTTQELEAELEAMRVRKERLQTQQSATPNPYG